MVDPNEVDGSSCGDSGAGIMRLCVSFAALGLVTSCFGNCKDSPLETFGRLGVVGVERALSSFAALQGSRSIGDGDKVSILGSVYLSNVWWCFPGSFIAPWLLFVTVCGCHGSGSVAINAAQSSVATRAVQLYEIREVHWSRSHFEGM